MSSFVDVVKIDVHEGRWEGGQGEGNASFARIFLMFFSTDLSIEVHLIALPERGRRHEVDRHCTVMERLPTFSL